MFRQHLLLPAAGLVLTVASISSACSSGTPASAASPAVPEPVAVTTAAVESRPIERHLRVTGSLMADEQAEVSAELAGRVTATPVERGSRVPAGTLLVRISAFPNWTAHGAKGPYRVDPNFMVVVPTSNDVHLDFGYSGPDRIGWTLTLGGLAGGIALWRLDRRRRAPPVLASETSAGPCVVDGPAGFPF